MPSAAPHANEGAEVSLELRGDGLVDPRFEGIFTLGGEVSRRIAPPVASTPAPTNPTMDTVVQVWAVAIFDWQSGGWSTEASPGQEGSSL